MIQQWIVTTAIFTILIDNLWVVASSLLPKLLVFFGKRNHFGAFVFHGYWKVKMNQDWHRTVMHFPSCSHRLTLNFPNAACTSHLRRFCALQDSMDNRCPSHISGNCRDQHSWAWKRQRAAQQQGFRKLQRQQVAKAPNLAVKSIPKTRAASTTWCS